MPKLFYSLTDWFIPAQIRQTESDLLMARTFVMLHILGPLMGQSVTYFLWQTPAGATWQFWAVEAMVLSFFATPLILRIWGNLVVAAMVSVQMLVCLSLFGSFCFGGISSPFLPWFLIAMVLGFFYLSDSIKTVLAGIAVQLIAFFSIRLLAGAFPEMLALSSLRLANTFSILAALCYMTLLSLYYETVMRIRMSVEEEMIDQQAKLALLTEAMEAAEAASKRKSIFLAKMSHELRTPLNAVIGYTEILRETFEEDENTAHKTQDLDRIHAAGRHLLALVDDVIDLSSIEANRLEISTEPVNVASLIEEVVATASPLVGKRANRLVVNMPEDLGTLELDALKVRQCMLNLLSNAAKFTTNGMIMLTVLAKQTDKGSAMVIDVTDNGIGMSQEGLKKIFEQFGQAENDTVSRFGGTGIGLALTRRLCQMMGGTIDVRSERGIGSSFVIQIPIIAAGIALEPAGALAGRAAA